MRTSKIIDRKSYLIALLTFAFSLYLFYSDSQNFINSLYAAIITGGLVWATYLILRVLRFAIKKK